METYINSVEWLTWGVDGYGKRHYLCRFCEKRFDGDQNFQDEIDHTCEKMEQAQQDVAAL